MAVAVGSSMHHYHHQPVRALLLRMHRISGLCKRAAAACQPQFHLGKEVQ